MDAARLFSHSFQFKPCVKGNAVGNMEETAVAAPLARSNSQLANLFVRNAAGEAYFWHTENKVYLGHAVRKLSSPGEHHGN